MKRALAVFAALAASSAFAQQNDWSIDLASGVAVMEEVSPLVFRVTNAASSAKTIASFTIGIPSQPYDIDGAVPPAGWRASAIDRRNRRVTFTAMGACGTPNTGLRPGQSALFEVRVLPVSQSRDQSNQNLDRNRTRVVDVCNTNANFRNYTGSSAWQLVGLAADVRTSVRALDVDDQLTVTLTVTNNSTATQNAIAPAAPVVSGTAAFTLVSGPTPASVSNLAQDAVATFSWVYRATARGSATFAARAQNTQVSSPTAVSSGVLVSAFPAATIATPSSVVSGGTVTVRVLPTNNGAETLTLVTPLPLSPTGPATVTPLSGPTPSQVDALSPRATTAFTTTWRVTGSPGDHVVFSGSVTAQTAAGATLTSDPVTSGDVRIDEVTVTASPEAVLSGAGATQIRYTVANGSRQPISSLEFIKPDANLFRTPSATAVPSGWTAGTGSRRSGISFTANNAAAQLQPGATQTFTIAFTSIGATTVNTPVSHKVQVTFADTTTVRTWDVVTVVVNRPVPDVLLPIAVATTGRAYFTWSNPSAHDGVLILRAAGAAPDTAPSAGVRYPPGTALGNATVVYEDALSFNTSFADTGLTNGTRYYYRLYNRDEFGLYSAGHVPAPSPGNNLLVIPPGTGASDPLWCTTVGLPALQQPYTDLGKAVYQSSNGAFITGSTITAGAPVNGNEKWRPTLTRGVVQARPTALRFGGAGEPSIFVGDQLGYAYRLNGGTGAITWTGNGGAPLGEVIQAPAVVAVRVFTNAAFQAAYADDLVFFATRNSANRASNSVTALAGATGARVFTYQPGDLDQVTGPVLFDYAGNTLWIASARASGPSLRVLDVLNPAAPPLLTVSDLGDIPSGVARNGNANQALVVDRSGVARAYSISSRTPAWELNVGGTVTQPLVTWGADFFVSTTTGVQRYHVDPGTNTVTAVWAAPTPLNNPSSVRVDAINGKLFVGDGDGWLRRLDAATGAVERSVKVSTAGGVSMPSYDSTAGLQRVYVGTADGRLCVYPSTFQ
ncbi:MAG: hypothetical protein AB1730_15345 [Myxococcota bacterium]